VSDLAAELAAQLGGDPLTKNLAELITIVRFRGDFRNRQRFPDEIITVELQASWGELYELIADVNEGYFDTTADLTTAADVAFVALPDDSWRVRAVDLIESNEPTELIQIGVAERNRYGTSTDKPCAYRLTARGIDLYPTPNAAYTLRVTYTPVVPMLDATPRKFYNPWEFILFGALLRISLQEERDATEWQRQLEIQRARIIRGASGRRSQGPEYLVLHDGYIDSDEVWR
jgi:hypothetical protein